jgi:hypothetical protein
MKLTFEDIVIFGQMKEKLVVFHLWNAVELVTIHVDHSLKGFDERSDGKKTLWASDEAYPLSIIATRSIQHAQGRTRPREKVIGISVGKIPTVNHDELLRDSSEECFCDIDSLT